MVYEYYHLTANSNGIVTICTMGSIYEFSVTNMQKQNTIAVSTTLTIMYPYNFQSSGSYIAIAINKNGSANNFNNLHNGFNLQILCDKHAKAKYDSSIYYINNYVYPYNFQSSGS